jgi:hypothetical protein
MKPSSLLQAKVLLILEGLMSVSVLKWWCSQEGLMFAFRTISFGFNLVSMRRLPVTSAKSSTSSCACCKRR